MALTALEFSILRTLLARPGFVFTRELILDAAYAGNIHVADRTIDSHVRNIRAKFAQCRLRIRDRDRARRRLQTRTLRGAALIEPSVNTSRKWRPSLSLVVFLVLTSVLVLPLFSIYFLKVYQNQLIQQVEAELIAQSAALAATFRREVETSVPPDVALGARIPPVARKATEPYQPIWPELELVNESVLPPRPEARPPAAPADPAFAALGARMMPDLIATQYVTLAGFRLLDPNGVVIAGRDEVGLSLAHLDEVREALQGRFKGVLRVRISKHDQPSLYSMSRGTGMRVFIAMPVIARDQVAGVVYASRTPSNVFKYLYEQRGRVILAMLSMIVPTLLIGFLFHRTITGPMRELVERTNLVGKGDRDALRPLRHHGTSEFALLSQSFLDMARRLNTRSSFISTFATHVSHELKSPLTSIKGAAELLREDVDAPDMDDADRRKFLDNIIADADRLGTIAGRLRDFARAENPIALGAAKLSVAISGLRAAFPALEIRAGGDLDIADADIRRQRLDHPFQSCRQRHAPRQFHVRSIRGTAGQLAESNRQRRR